MFITHQYRIHTYYQPEKDISRNEIERKEDLKPRALTQIDYIKWQLKEWKALDPYNAAYLQSYEKDPRAPIQVHNIRSLMATWSELTKGQGAFLESYSKKLVGI